MPELGFGGVSTFQQYRPDTMSTVSRQVIDAAKKIKAAPYQPDETEIAQAKKSGTMTRAQAQYVIGLNPEKDPREVLKDLVENQGYQIEGLESAAKKTFEQPKTFGETVAREAKRAFVTAPATVLGSGAKLIGGAVDIGEELFGGGDGLGEKIKGAGEALQNKAMDFGEIQNDREALKTISDIAFPVGGLAGSVAKYATKVPGVAKASEVLSKIPGAAKTAQILGPDKIAGVAARGVGYGALGTAMAPGADLGDIAEGGLLGGALG
jgi:hypothetical protein